MFDFFSLAVNYSKFNTLITMRLFTDILTTCDIPDTFSILQRSLPSILKAKCYNDKNLPFRQEVKNTEIGHLFEHILLEYLCKFQLAKGIKNAEFSGVTDWDWRKHPRGTFHINILSGLNIKDSFPLALEKSSQLLTSIIKSSTFQNNSYFNFTRQFVFKAQNFHYYNYKIIE